MNSGRAWLIIGGVLVAATVFQLFFRYQYIQRGYTILRIDRVSGSSCYMPCTPAPPITPSPQPTIEDIAPGNQRAISLVQSSGAALNFPSGNSHGQYEWNIWGEYTNDGKQRDPLSPGTRSYPVRIVCYCNDHDGWYWEVHLDTGSIYEITGNRYLELKYGFAPPTAEP